MSKSYKIVPCSGALAGVVSDAVAALAELGEECRAAADNFASPDHPKAQAFAEAADVLEGVQEPEVPDCCSDVVVSYGESVPRRKRHSPGRAVRCYNAASALSACAEAVREWADDPANADHDDLDAATQLADELEGIASEVEGVEFPGMFG